MNRIVAITALMLVAGTARAENDPPPPLCDAMGEGCTLAAAWADWIEAHPSRQTLLTYAVRCALPESARVTIPGAGTLAGQWGLRPRWESEELDLDDQEVVSACVIASINAFGAKVLIALTGPDVTFVVPPTFRNMEGVFFGNLFRSPMRKKVCRGRGDGLGSAAIDEDKRICSSNASTCGLESVGSCDDNPAGGCTRWAGVAPHVYCAEAMDGSGAVYDHPITVYLQTRE